MVLAARIRAATIAGLVFTSLALPRAEAAVAREISLNELCSFADVAVVGVPEESRSLWEEIPGAGRRIVTYTRVHVDEIAFGSAAADVWVRTLGGAVGNVGQRVEGEAMLVPGERAVLFLKATTDGTHLVTEMAQGHFPVKADGGAERLRPSPRLGALVRGSAAKSAQASLVGRPVREALSMIRSERKATGR
jgi:hypothetical protein